MIMLVKEMVASFVSMGLFSVDHYCSMMPLLRGTAKWNWVYSECLHGFNCLKECQVLYSDYCICSKDNIITSKSNSQNSSLECTVYDGIILMIQYAKKNNWVLSQGKDQKNTFTCNAASAERAWWACRTTAYSGKNNYVNPMEIPGFLHKLVIKFDLHLGHHHCNRQT